MLSPSKTKRARTKHLIRQREKAIPEGWPFCFPVVEAEPIGSYIARSAASKPQRRFINQLNPCSPLRSVAAILVAVVLWLPSASGTPVDDAREWGISQAAGATLALPSAPVRLVKATAADARSALARDINQWIAALPENSTIFWGALRRRTAPAGNGQAPAAVLALTFSYYATAPPSLRG